MAEGIVKTFIRDYVLLNRLEIASLVLEQLPGRFDDHNEIAPYCLEDELPEGV
jgi:hypothetical protein